MFCLWLKANLMIVDATISVKKDRLYHNNRSRFAHGVVTYINSDITHCRRSDLEYENSEEFNTLFLKCGLNRKNGSYCQLTSHPALRTNCLLTN